jgi:hypothetical protein
MTRRPAALLEELLCQAMRAADPAAALKQAARDRRLPEALRRALGTCDLDGVRLTALLIAKLRFERLLRASEEAEWLFQRDPASFAELFRRYHAEVPPTAFFPAAEARLFRRFLKKSS